MPKRTDIESILIIGAGPIVIGQSCEFDYSGTQACLSLKEEGYRIILVNSNPATIMTDPNIADATYIEPINWQILEDIIAKERPDALLPTMGGQTALNCALDLDKKGILTKYGVQMIGANRESIDKAEDRWLFRKSIEKIGLKSPNSYIAHNMKDAEVIQQKIDFPIIIRPFFTLGGSGGGIAYNKEQFVQIALKGFSLSPTKELLIEENIIGWKEFELEVVRDCKDNCIIVCSIENIDPMGIHTGDSITVAPAQTLTDQEYQHLRDCSIKILREIGVETGGANVQFAINPKNGCVNVIEMNPRVSRSSALASKATGFPIAKVAAKLAVGFTLDELSNDLTGNLIPASFEPTIDYIVCKMPKFTFEKFSAADNLLTTQMKSVGEAMAIGSNFNESIQKAIRGLEIDRYGFDSIISDNIDIKGIRQYLTKPTSDRIWYIADSFRLGMTVNEVYDACKIDKWFLINIKEIIDMEKEISKLDIYTITKESLFYFKKQGFSDIRLAYLMNTSEKEVYNKRLKLNIKPVFKRVDSCAAEFPVDNAYMYSTYQIECESFASNNKKIMILGGGPNRIGQGIEFDYCCVHAALSARENGYETIMVNCNPETVSTDYNISDRLYFESLNFEDVMSIINVEKPDGVIVHYGGQTPLKLAKKLHMQGVKIIGTNSTSIDLAEDREKFKQFLNDLDLKQPENGIAHSKNAVFKIAEKIDFPLVIRPSYVLGGLGMEILYDKNSLEKYLKKNIKISKDYPILLDRFLDHAIEIDIDAVSDGEKVIVAGIMEHIEQAGIHSGDSACSLPPYSLSNEIIEKIEKQVTLMAKKLKVIGLLNVQLAYQDDEIYVIEVNPRASRTVPFVSKSKGISLASIGTCCMLGIKLKDQNIPVEKISKFYSIKEAVFPFDKFEKVDPLLGPEMKSTGEVMGVAKTFGGAYGKALLATGIKLPKKGKVFVSLRDLDDRKLIDLAKDLLKNDFEIFSTSGNYKMLQEEGIKCHYMNKVYEGSPHVIDQIKNNQIDLIIITTEDRADGVMDSAEIRKEALKCKIPVLTTISASFAYLRALDNDNLLNKTHSLQSIFH